MSDVHAIALTLQNLIHGVLQIVSPRNPFAMTFANQWLTPLFAALHPCSDQYSLNCSENP
jgi:hypothetical protein